MDAIPISRRRNAIMALGNLVAVILAVWLSFAQPNDVSSHGGQGAWLAVLGPDGLSWLLRAIAGLFAVAALVMSRRAVQGGDLLRIQPDGIAFATLRNHSFAPWQDIDPIVLVELKYRFTTGRWVKLNGSRQIPVQGAAATLDEIKAWINRANAARLRQ